MKLSLSEQLLLGLLAEQPRHGYEIENVIAERGMREWTSIGFSSIYYLLDQLKKKKLADAQNKDGPPQSRRLFRITKRGVIECRRATETTLLHAPSNEPLLVGLANTPFIGTDKLAELLRKRIEKTEQDLKRVKKARHTQTNLPVFAHAIFDFNLRKMKAEIEWAKSTIRKLKEEQHGQNRSEKGT